jgi:hypothetical protein
MFGNLVRFAGMAMLALATVTCSSDVAGPPSEAPDITGGLTLAQGGVLFGARFTGSSGAASLYTINPATGAAALVGAIGFDRVSGMDFHPTTGILYATAQRPIGDVPVLITIDPGTGLGTEVGPTGMPGDIADVSFRSDGTLFALDATNPVGGHRLWTVDVTTGAGTLVGSIPGSGTASGNGIAHDASGATLFYSDENNTYTLDQSTAARTTLAAVSHQCPGGPGDGRINAADLLASGGAGVVFAIRVCGFPATQAHLITMNYATGAENPIGQTTLGMDALAWSHDEAGEGPGICAGQTTSAGVTSFTFNSVTTFIGTSGPDVIAGTDHIDVVIAKGGNDLICTHQGADVIDGGPDDDVVFGGTQKDRIFGKEGSDLLFGEEGQDRIDGGHTPVPSSTADTQPDICVGGPGVDRYYLCETIVDDFTSISSARFKQDVVELLPSGTTILGLRPVAFRYLEGYGDPSAPQVGLVAEEVFQVYPEAVVLDEEERPYGIEYRTLNALLLEEAGRCSGKALKDGIAQLAGLL